MEKSLTIINKVISYCSENYYFNIFKNHIPDFYTMDLSELKDDKVIDFANDFINRWQEYGLNRELDNFENIDSFISSFQDYDLYTLSGVKSLFTSYEKALSIGNYESEECKLINLYFLLSHYVAGFRVEDNF